MKNWKQFYAIEAQNKKRILAVNPKVPERSGIYILTRYDNGLDYCYIGQSVNLLQRLAGHLKGYQHIDLSLKKHGLFSQENPTGWDINFVECAESELNEKEQEYILKYGKAHQLRNKTSGSQGKGKKSIAETERKGYNQGLANGYKKAQKEIAKLFEKNLYAAFQGKPNKLKEKALWKFQKFINMENENGSNRIF